MKKENYSELLKDPRWQKKRLEIMQRDEFTCQHCGSKERQLHVHHLLYYKDHKPWEYENDKLITLCENCHENETIENKELYGNFLEVKEFFNKKGFSNIIFNTILRNISCFLNENEEDGYLKDDVVKELIVDTILGTQRLSDLETLKKIGIAKKEVNKLIKQLSNIKRR